MMDFVGRAKWDAWNGLKDQTVEQAQQAYADLVDQLAGAEVGDQLIPKTGTIFLRRSLS